MGLNGSSLKEHYDVWCHWLFIFGIVSFGGSCNSILDNLFFYEKRKSTSTRFIPNVCGLSFCHCVQSGNLHNWCLYDFSHQCLHCNHFSAHYHHGDVSILLERTNHFQKTFGNNSRRCRCSFNYCEQHPVRCWKRCIQ